MRENEKVMGVANAFSGGVFLAIGFTHLLKEANETLEEVMKKGKADDFEPFPLAYFICILR